LKVREILLCKVNVRVGRKRGIYGAHVNLYPVNVYSRLWPFVVRWKIFVTWTVYRPLT